MRGKYFCVVEDVNKMICQLLSARVFTYRIITDYLPFTLIS